jgi:hypothetical protein
LLFDDNKILKPEEKLRYFPTSFPSPPPARFMKILIFAKQIFISCRERSKKMKERTKTSNQKSCNGQFENMSNAKA